MVDFIDRNIERLTKVEYGVTITIFLIMLFLMVVQVVFRYILEIPLGWSEEVIRFMFVATSFMGATIATKEREHIEINVVEVYITNKFSNNQRRKKYASLINIFRDVITSGFLAFISWEAWKYMIDIHNMKSLSAALLFPMWIVVAFVFAGLFLSMIHTIALIILNLYGRGVTGFDFDGGENCKWN